MAAMKTTLRHSITGVAVVLLSGALYLLSYGVVLRCCARPLATAQLHIVTWPDWMFALYRPVHLSLSISADFTGVIFRIH